MSKSKKQPFSFDKLRTLFVVLCFLYALAAIVTYFSWDPGSRAESYLSPDDIIVEVRKELAREQAENPTPEIEQNISKEKIKQRIQSIFDGKLTSYQTKVPLFYTTIFLTLIFCVLGIIVLLLPDREIQVPAFPEIKIPTYIFYLVIPTCLCYGWIQFGFYLHHLIEARMTLMNLIHAQAALAHPPHWCLGSNNLVTYDGECYKYYYSLTRANDLKDTGFLDSWFLCFLPTWFPTHKMGTAIVVPWATLVAIGILYGISHGFQLGMILNWMSRYAPKFKPRVRMVPYILLAIVTTFFLTSHWAFYRGRNQNWAQVVILITTAFVFRAITSDSVRNYYQKKEKEEKLTGKTKRRQK